MAGRRDKPEEIVLKDSVPSRGVAGTNRHRDIRHGPA